MQIYKSVLFFVLAVCVAGVALIMLNEQHADLPSKNTPILSSQQKPVPPLEREKTLQHTLPLSRQQEEPEKKPTLNAEAAKEKPLPPNAEAAKEKPLTPKAQERVKPEEPKTPPQIPAPAKPLPSDNDSMVSQLRPIARTEADIRQSEKEQARSEAGKKQEEQKAEGKEKPKEIRDNTQKEQTAGKEKQKEAENAKKEGKSAIQRLVVFSREKGATVRLTGNKALPYKTSRMHAPERILIEIQGDWDVANAEIPKNPFVTAVRVGKQNGTTRVVIDMKADPKTVRFVEGKEKHVLDIRVDE